jgi:hypothetical protein
MTLRLIFIAIGFVGGNFVYQAACDQDYSLATSRSFFQLAVIFAIWVSFTLVPVP